MSIGARNAPTSRPDMPAKALAAMKGRAGAPKPNTVQAVSNPAAAAVKTAM